jgi:hypothetical protein
MPNKVYAQMEKGKKHLFTFFLNASLIAFYFKVLIVFAPLSMFCLATKRRRNFGQCCWKVGEISDNVL